MKAIPVGLGHVVDALALRLAVARARGRRAPRVASTSRGPVLGHRHVRPERDGADRGDRREPRVRPVRRRPRRRPRSTSSRAVARPIPEPAPVTTTGARRTPIRATRPAPSIHQEAARGVDRRAGDVARVVGREEHDRARPSRRAPRRSPAASASSCSRRSRATRPVMSIGVWTWPGDTQLTVMRCGPNVRASPRQTDVMPPLVAAYATEPPKPPVHQPWRAEEDDPAALALLDHRAARGARQEERGLEVDVVLEVPVLLGHLVEASRAGGAPRRGWRGT